MTTESFPYASRGSSVVNRAVSPESSSVAAPFAGADANTLPSRPWNSSSRSCWAAGDSPAATPLRPWSTSLPIRLTSSRSLPENPLANDFAIALPETAASACPGGGGATSRACGRSRGCSSGASGNHSDGQ